MQKMERRREERRLGEWSWVLRCWERFREDVGSGGCVEVTKRFCDGEKGNCVRKEGKQCLSLD